VNPVKVYDNSGSLKKVISSKNPSQYRKTNKNKPISAKSSDL